MTNIEVREARLDDTQAISALFRTQISVWQRMGDGGQVEDLPYDSLTIYERWLHGDGHNNPWLSQETAAIFLSHLLNGAGIPLVAEVDGVVGGYVELYQGSEPAPFDSHLHIAHLIVHPVYRRAGVENALMDYLPHLAEVRDCRRVTVTVPGFDAERAAFYGQHGMATLTRVRRYSIPAQTGQGFYKAVAHPDADPAQINGLYMPLGRLESARQQWETVWPALWGAVPQVEGGQRIHRQRFNASGHDAFIACHTRLYQPRAADVYCWSPKPLTSQLLVAIRDWAHREGYRTLFVGLVDAGEPLLKLLGPDAEPEPHHYEVYSLEV